MSEMVERVARVLQDMDDSFTAGEPLNSFYIAEARAVIIAMQKPTEDMSTGAANIWCDMIYNVLK